MFCSLMLPIAPIDFIIWYTCEFSEVQYMRREASGKLYQHLALAIMNRRKNERNHSPIEINDNTHCTPVRTGFQAMCIGKGMSPASLKWFHLQKFSLMSYVERILNIVLVYYCSVVCLGVNLTTNLCNDEVPNSKDDQSTVFEKLKKSFPSKTESLGGSVMQVLFLRQLSYSLISVRTTTFALHFFKEL